MSDYSSPTCGELTAMTVLLILVVVFHDFLIGMAFLCLGLLIRFIGVFV